jgi:D-alanyl-lipoteichoic acid acyltransferase DltB (MBOAT superfamily)
MLFNSPEYFVFLPVAVVVFFLLPARVRWVWLLGVSWYFYALWSARYLALFIGNTLVAYLAGLGLRRATDTRHKNLIAGGAITVLLGTLFVFKYIDFLGETLVSLLELFGASASYTPLRLELPIGVSFYTFQAIAYVVDVRVSRVPAEAHAGRFALYKAFFPQMVAGPIERPARLLPKLREPTELTYERITSGASLILWGLVKKIVIADRLAIYVNEVYDHPGKYHGLTVVLATYFFAFQIYGDFSGYSDIAVGSARLFGYDLMQNFDRPYLARSIREFWGRWHISLSTWFRDYVYVPLGGNRRSPWRTRFNVLAVFLLSGLWHGAAWTFVAWGALHGLYLLAGDATKSLRSRAAQALGLSRVPRLSALAETLFVFHLVCLAWVFFRATGFDEAWTLIAASTELDGSRWLVPGVSAYELALSFLCIAALMAMSVWQRQANTADFLITQRTGTRWGLQWAMLVALVLFGQFNVTKFIYFQF